MPAIRDRTRTVLVIATVLFLAGCQPPPPAPTATVTLQPTPAPTLAADFDLRFEIGDCYWHILDTASGIYQRIVQGELVVELPFVLSETERATIRDKLTAMDFFSYPAHFTVPVPTDGIVRQVQPSYTYKLIVYSADKTHTVEWIDDQPDSLDPPAQRLRELFRFLRGLLGQRPEMQALPTPGVVCV
jgi:hypothetical protein